MASTKRISKNKNNVVQLHQVRKGGDATKWNGLSRKKANSLKRTPLNKVSPREVPRLKRTLWRLFSKLIRERDPACVTCGSKSNPQAGHFIPRQHNATLFDPLNVWRQCSNCNLYLHGNIPAYIEFIKSKLGDDGFDYLILRGKEVKQWTVPELKKLIEASKKGYKQYTKVYQKIEI